MDKVISGIAFLDRTVELPIGDDLFYEKLQKRINKKAERQLS